MEQRELALGREEQLMVVLDEEPDRWFFLEEDSQLYLDAICSHSAVDYLFLLAVNEEEVRLFRRKGRAYLDDPASRIHYGAPGVRGSRSPYKARSLVMTSERERADEAVSRWQVSKRT